MSGSKGWNDAPVYVPPHCPKKAFHHLSIAVLPRLFQPQLPRNSTDEKLNVQSLTSTINTLFQTQLRDFLPLRNLLSPLKQPTKHKRGPRTLTPLISKTPTQMCQSTLTLYDCGYVAGHQHTYCSVGLPSGQICNQKETDNENISWLSYKCRECKTQKGWKKWLARFKGGRRRRC